MKKISITLTRYNEQNELVAPCIKMLSKQKNIKAVVYFLDQKNDKDMMNLCKKLSNSNVKILYRNIPAKSLSYARNEGIRLCRTDVLLFIDCDAIPKINWAYELSKTFDVDKKIAIVGGKSVPKWLKKPRWYNKSNIAMEVYSLIDLSNKTIPTNKIVGVNFGLKKSLLGKEACFDENLGRRPGSLLGGEESDLCRRTLSKKLKVFYTPDAVVEHQIQLDRMSLYWLMRRFYYGGLGKAIMGGKPQTYCKKRNVYDKVLLPIIAVPYILGYNQGRKLKNEK